MTMHKQRDCNGCVFTCNLTAETVQWIDDHLYEMFFSRSEFVRFAIVDAQLNNVVIETLPDWTRSSKRSMLKLVTMNVSESVADYISIGGNRCANIRAIVRRFIERLGYYYKPSGAIAARSEMPAYIEPSPARIPEGYVQVGDKLYQLGRRSA